MLGHILRCDDLNPAQLALHFAIESNKLYKGRIGRHQTNLIRVIMNDVKCRDLKLNDIQDLYTLKHLAQNRKLWKELEIKTH